VTHSFRMFVFNTANKHSISVLKQNSNPNRDDNMPVYICTERQCAFPLIHCKKSSAVTLQLNCQKHVNMSTCHAHRHSTYSSIMLERCQKWNCIATATA